METVARFKEGQPIVVSRYEKDLLVGERKVYFNDFVLAMLEELPDADILYHLVNVNMDVVIKYIEDNYGLEQHTKLLFQIFDIVESNGDLQNKQRFRQFLFKALSFVDWSVVGEKYLFQFFDNAFKRLSKIEDSEQESLKELIMLLLSKLEFFRNTDKELTRIILSRFAEYAKKNQSQADLKLLFESIINHLEPELIQNVIDQMCDDRLVKKIITPRNLVYYEHRTKKDIFILEIPKTKIRVKFHDVVYEEVGHPRLFFILTLKGEKIDDIYLFAAKDKDIFIEDIQLFYYPFSNVYESGKVCWTGFREEIILSGKDLEIIPHLFLNTPNNNHLNGHVRRIFEEFNFRDYDEECLKPYPETLTEIMNRI